MAAIALGLVGHRGLSGRLGLNHLYDAFGNAATAAVMGALGHAISKQTTFLVAAMLCLPAAWALTRIRGNETDYSRARAARLRERPREAVRFRELARNHNLLVLIATLSLFQFANASVMPLASDRLEADQQTSELVTAALVVVPQLVTALIASWWRGVPKIGGAGRCSSQALVSCQFMPPCSRSPQTPGTSWRSRSSTA